MPNLAKNEHKLSDLCKLNGLQFRKEEDKSECVYDLSNRATIGQTEFDLVSSVCVGIRKILDEELKLGE